MKHGIERIISRAVEASAGWIRRKPLLTLVLALLLLKSFPIIAMVLLLAIGIAVFMRAQQPAHLVVELDGV